MTFTPLRRIAAPKGDILHGLRSTDAGFAGFGEAYFTMIDHGAVKGWRRHREMVLNLMVPVGCVRFVVHEEGGTATDGATEAFDVSGAQGEYGRLTVQPGLWVAFQGVGPDLNMVLNVASIPHDPQESVVRPLESIPWRF